MPLALKNVIQLDIKIGKVKANAGARDALPLFIVFQKGFDEICAKTLVVDHSPELRPITDLIKKNLQDDKNNDLPDFNLRQIMPDGYGVDYREKIENVQAGIDHQVNGDLLASLGVVLKTMQKIPKGYMTEYTIGYNANQEGANFELGIPSREFSNFNPDGTVSPYPLVEQAWDALGHTALIQMRFKVLLNFDELWQGKK